MVAYEYRGICHRKACMETDRVMPKTVTCHNSNYLQLLKATVILKNAESKSSVTDILEESIDSNEVVF